MRKLFILLSLVSLNVSAQDVIVKKDGSTILSKVLEVNPADIKYKKFSNQNGPTYTITKAEVMSINYESGDKDVFTDSQPATQPAAANANYGVNPNLEADNLNLVREFNSIELTQKEGVKAKDYLLTFLLGLKEGSIINTPELEASFTMKHWYGRVTMFGNKVKNERTLDLGEDPGMKFYNDQYKIVVTLKNKTNSTVFIDLANSFTIRDNNAKPYFITGESNGSYSQRVISIPPMSSLSLEPQVIGQGRTWVTTRNSAAEYDIVKDYIPYFTEKGYAKDDKKVVTLFENLEKGEKIDIPVISDVNPLSIHITYSLDEKITTSQSMHMDFYLRQVLKGDNWDCSGGNKVMFFDSRTIWKLIKT
jgi:hypothetical protein